MNNLNSVIIEGEITQEIQDREYCLKVARNDTFLYFILGLKASIPPLQVGMKVRAVGHLDELIVGADGEEIVRTQIIAEHIEHFKKFFLKGEI